MSRITSMDVTEYTWPCSQCGVKDWCVDINIESEDFGARSHSTYREVRLCLTCMMLWTDKILDMKRKIEGDDDE